MQTTKILAVFAFLLTVGVTVEAQTSGMVKKTAKPVEATAAGQVAAGTQTFLVLGNCGMCQQKIEKAARDQGATSAAWNMDTRMLTVTFDATKTSVEAIQKAIAMAGYDNAGYKAPNDVYDNLHGCCQYDRSGAPGTAKSCAASAGQAEGAAVSVQAQSVAALTTATFKVRGDCGMCEKTIVRAAKDAGAVEASWDMDSHVMVVKFPEGATTVEKIHQAIAAKGYDTPTVLASEATYKALPTCCQYDRDQKLDD
jgi:outer membrane receptor for ferrienterochelin and colicins